MGDNTLFSIRSLVTRFRDIYSSVGSG